MTRNFKHSKKFLGSISYPSRVTLLKTLPVLVLMVIVALTSNGLSPIPTARAGSLLPPTLVKYFDDHTCPPPISGIQQPCVDPNIDYINAYQTSVLKFVITNPNPNAGNDLQGINFADPFPTGVYLANLSPVTNTCTGAGLSIVGNNTVDGNNVTTGSVNISHVDLKATNSCTITFSVTTVNAGNYDNGTGPINAQTGTTTSQNYGEAKLSVQNQLVPPTVTKKFTPGAVSAGGASSITITIKNPNGKPSAPFPTTLNDYPAVNFTDDFSGTGIKISTTTFINASCNGAANPLTGSLKALVNTGVIELIDGYISANTTCTITVPVTAPNGVNDYINTIKAGSVTFDGGANQIDVNAHLIVSQSLTLAKAFGVGSLPAGTPTTMTFTLTNPNTTALTNVNLNDTFPAGSSMVVDLPSNAGGTCTNANGVTVTANRRTITSATIGVPKAVGLNPGTCTITISVIDPISEDLTNTVNVTNYTINGTSVPVAISAQASLTQDTTNPTTKAPQSVKAFNPATIVYGGISTMSIDIHNPNLFPMVGVNFNDLLPSGLVFVEPVTFNKPPVINKYTISGCGVSTTATFDQPFKSNVNSVNIDRSNTPALSLNGGTIAAGGDCKISVDVSASPGSNPDVTTVTNPNVQFNNSITVNSLNVIPGTSNTATLTVNDFCTGGCSGNQKQPQIVKTFSNSPINPGDITTLTIVITNPNQSVSLFGTTFTDDFSGNPIGMVIAADGSNHTSKVTVSSDLVNCIGLSVSAPVDTQTVTLTGGEIGPGASCTIKVDVTATTPTTPSSTGYTNTINNFTTLNYGKGQPTSDTLVVNGTTTLLPANIYKYFPDLTPGAPSIPVSTTASPVTTTLAIVVYNPNAIALTDVSIGDPLPSNLNWVSTDKTTSSLSLPYPVSAPTTTATANCFVQYPSASDSFTYNNTTHTTGATEVDGFIPSLPAGEACYFLFKVYGKSLGDATNTILAKNATSLNGGDSPASNPATVPVVGPPVISKGFVGAAIADGSTKTTLRLVITNPNPTTSVSLLSSSVFTLTGIGLTDSLPDPNSDPLAQMTVNHIDIGKTTCPLANITVNGANTSISLAGLTLTGGQQCEIDIVVDTPGALTYNNKTSTPSSDNGGSTGSAASANIAVSSIVNGLDVHKDFSPRTLFVNLPSTMSIVITNQSKTQDQSEVNFDDKMPLGLYFYSTPALTQTNCGVLPTMTQATVSTPAHLILTGGTITAANPVCTITVQVTSPTTNNQLSNVVSVTSLEVQTPTTASRALVFIGPPSVTKLFNPTKIESGQIGILQFKITNPNTIVPLDAVTLTDDLPLGMRVTDDPGNNPQNIPGISADCGNGSSFTFTPDTSSVPTKAGTLNFNLGSINAGGAFTCILTVHVTALPGSYTNTLGPNSVVPNPPGSWPPCCDIPPTAKLDVYGYDLGNRVWFDTNNDGKLDNGESPVPSSVKITLTGTDYAGNAITPRTTTTDANGYYRFDSLGAGTYKVTIDASNFQPGGLLEGYISSTGSLASTDSNDNGLDSTTSASYATAVGISSGPITLNNTTAIPMPTATDQTGAYSVGSAASTYGPYGPPNDTHDNLTIDFGLVKEYSVGNRVWRDDGNGASASLNDGQIDNGEAGIDGVKVNLYAADASGNPTGAILQTTTTSGGGYYRFDTLQSATPTTTPKYVVVVDTNPVNSPGLKNLVPSTPTFTTLTTDNDNSLKQTLGAGSVLPGGVASPAFGFPANAISTETDVPGGTNSTLVTGHGPNGDNFDNLGVDFGFVPTYSIGNRVWKDNGNGTTNDGLLNNSEVGIDSVKLNLYAADGSGNPTGSILQTTTTSGGGYYRFDGLLPYSPTTSPRYVVVLDTSTAAGHSTGLVNMVPSDPTFTDLTLDNHNKVQQTLGGTGVLPGGLASPAFGFPGDAVTTESDVVAGNGTSVNSYGPNGNTYDNLDVDFGFVPTYSIGNRVWRDDGSGTTAAQYNDGKRETGEVGLASVKVNLYAADSSGNPTGPILQTIPTDGTGYYRFDGLLASSATISRKYVVVVDTNTANSPVLLGYTPSQPTFTDQTTDDENMVKQVLGSGSVLPGGVASPAFDFPTNAILTETDVTGGTGSILSDHGPNGNANDNLTADFGFVPTFSLGNRLWYDTNNNGHIDLGESPVVGAQVDLFDNKTGKALTDSAGNPMHATTDANGYYRFDGLLPGDYYVVIDKSNWVPKTALPAGPLNGYASSTNNIAQTGVTTADSFDNGIDDANPAANGIKSPVITLGLGNEPTTDTDTAGPVGTGAPSVDAANNVVSDYGNAYDNLTVDFGFYKLSVGDTVWNDNGGSSSNIPANANNGKQDANEPGIPGVTVQLFKGGVLVAQTTTDGSGKYLFDQQTDVNNANPANHTNPTGNPLIAGSDYTIVIPKGQAALTGFESSTDISSTFNPTTIGNGVNADDNGKGTSSANTADTVSDAFSLNVFGYNNTAGSVQKPNALTDNPTLDFGFHQVVANTYSIGNRVWLDDGTGNGTANNGVQDGTEKGLDGVRVLLYNTDATGNPTTLVQTQTTSGGGYYRFDSVPAGTTGAPLTYMVIVDRNNSPILNGLITSNNTYVDYNAPGDKQNKGAQTPLSAVVPNGIPSGIVTLSNPSTTTPKSTNPVTGEPDVTSTTPFGTNGPNGDTFDVLTVDFGFYQPIGQPYSIGNRVWLDNGVGGTLLSANDGIQNGNETGIPNVKVDLFAADATGKATGPILQTQQTDGNGYYRFDNIYLATTGNKYVVVIDTSVASSPALNGLKLSMMPVPTDYGATGDQHNKGSAMLPADLTAIGLTSGVSSGVITITNPATPPTSTNPVTGEPDVTGSGQGAHSAAGDTNDILTADFGFYSDVTTGYSIGNRVWIDDGAGAGVGGIANDGIQNGSEIGVAQMPLKLFVANSSGAPTGSPVQTISTDASGYYRFDGVNPGSYVVVMDLPSFNASSAVTKYKLTGASFTDYQTDQQNVGKQTVLDSSSPLPGGIVSPLILITNPATAPTSTNPVLNEKDISTGLGAHGPSLDVNDILTADFGLVAIPPGTFSIGNRVWLDNGGGVPANVNNGKQDANEPGIPNATVYLYASNAGAPSGAALQTTVTDNSGYYRFDGVAAGKYVVVVDQDAIKSPGLVGLLPSTFPGTLTPANSTLFTTASDQFTKGGPLSGLAAVPTGVVSGEIDTANVAASLNEPDVVAAGAGAHGPLGDGSDILTADFGFYVDATKAYSIGNRVWFDNGAGGGTPNDGKQNGTEPGIPNVKLELFYADKAGSPVGTVPLSTTSTDANGYYRFDGVTPGDYVVVVDKVGSTSLNGFTPSTPHFTDYTTTGDQQNKGLLTPLTQTSPVPGGTVSSLITVAPSVTPLPLTEPDVIVGNASSPAADHAANGDNHDLLTADFSYITAPTTYSIGNRIWNDLNKDGVQQSNEPGIGGVSVLLYKSDTNGNPTTKVGNVTTDGSGFYRFDGLTPGDYVVIVDVANSPALNGSTLTKTVITTPNANTTDAENNGIATTTALISGGVPSGKISLGARPSEPIGELVPASDAAGSVFTISAAPQSSDDHGNLTIDFGFILPTANVYAFDPVMVKLVDPSLALPGESVTFTITISNFGTVAAPNVIITDPLPSRLVFTGADTPQGSFSANGNTITFLLGTLTANQVISVHVHAKIDPNVVPPVDLTNTATAVLNGKTITATTLNASATLHVTGGKLPNTGEHPAPQSAPSDSLLTGLLVGLGAITVAFRMRQLWRITR